MSPWKPTPSSLRIDGLLLPKKQTLPVYFVEVQCQSLATFYANLFAKVFAYLEENDPEQDWRAVAIFGDRKHEPANVAPYQVLLDSHHVHRIYLEDHPIPADPSLGLGILQLLSAPPGDIKHLLSRMNRKAQREIADSETGRKVLQLAEELLLRRFTECNREEIRQMFQLQDIRKSKVWQEAHEEGVEEGIEKGKEMGEARALKKLIDSCLARGLPIDEIAAIVELPIKDVRRLAKKSAK